MVENNRVLQGSGRCMCFTRPVCTIRTLHSLLLMGSASIVLLGGSASAYAEGRTFVWTGNENLTSFGRAGNWDQVLEFGNPVLDGDGNPTFELIPLTDDDGNPVFDDDDNQVYKNGDQIFEPPFWVDGPPDGLDNMVVTTGTPNMSGQPRSVWDLYLSGGEFIIRNSKQATTSFSVDGTLNLSGSGALQIGQDILGQSTLTVANVDMTGGSVSGWLTPDTLASGAGRFVVTGSMKQSGGHVSDIAIQTPTYALSGGALAANVDFSTRLDLSGTGEVEAGSQLAGAEGSAMTQSGGTMDGTVTGIDNYAHSGGNIGGSVTTQIYTVTNAAATSDDGVIHSGESFDLAIADGTAIVAAKLSGDGNLIKSGASTVILAHRDNDFTGTVAVNAGTLEVIDDSLPTYSAVTIADAAALLMNTANDTVFMGSIVGEVGELIKQGSASLTLGGDILLGGLRVDAGKIQVGTGLSENVVSFDYALVDEGAILYVASGATLTIRIPNNLVNNGTFINDGTVNDDLDNTGPFINNKIYNAKVLSNTGSINNNSDGVWTGDILGNANIINNNTGAEWTGDIVGNDGIITNHEGAIWNGDVVSNGGSGGFVPIINRGLWTGDVRGNSGFVFNDGGTWDGDIVATAGGVVSNGSWIGDIKSNESQIINDEGGVWTGDILGNNNLIHNGIDGVWTGDVFGNGGGSNGLTQINNYGSWQGIVFGNAAYINNLSGSWTGDIIANSGMIRNNHNDPTTNPTGANGAVWNGNIWGTNSQIVNENGGIWNGDILGNNNAIFNEIGGVWYGAVVANAGGSNIHTQIVNRGDWTGDVQTNARTIYNEAGGTWDGDVLANAGKIVTGGIWDGDFSSAGSVIAEGEINGVFTNSGQLQVTGSLTGITTLTNTGIVSLKGRGTSQRLTVGDVNFSNGSYYDIDVDAAGASDKIVAQNVVIDGGTVRVSAANTGGTYGPSTIYTIVNAAAVTGEFDAVTIDLAFLAPKLSYQVATVDLTLMRNDTGFADTGVTQNQQAAAASAQSLGAGNAVYDTVLWLSTNEAAKSFDDLSGEIHASAHTVLIEDSQFIRDTANDRLRAAFGDVRASLNPVLAYGPGDVPVLVSADHIGPVIWSHGFGSWGAIKGDGTAAALDRSTAGMLIGADGLVGDWRLGLLAGYSHSSFDVDDRASSGSSDNYHLGLYGGTEWGNLAFRTGTTLTWHDIETNRAVSFPGFTDSLSADYDASTFQAFGEIGYGLEIDSNTRFEPFANLAHVSLRTNGFREQGGAAALSADSGGTDVTFTTYGVRAEHSLGLGTIDATLRGMIGWRHAFRDTTPESAYAFSAGDAFTIAGVSIGRDSAVIEAGLDLNLTPGATFGLSYTGQIGSAAYDHGSKANLAVRF